MLLNGCLIFKVLQEFNIHILEIEILAVKFWPGVVKIARSQKYVQTQWKNIIDQNFNISKLKWLG